MEFIRTEIPSVIKIKPTIHKDERGYFVETFRQDLLDEFLGEKINFLQDNESFSRKGVLRGMHFQLGKSAQTKLVRVVSGSVLDVAVDVRENSETFGRYVAVELNSENKLQLLIPRGFAHGFVALSSECIFSYKVDNAYCKELERGFRYDDQDVNINWKLDSSELLLSHKDLQLPFLRDLKEKYSI